jgi:hypothetical protein
LDPQSIGQTELLGDSIAMWSQELGHSSPAMFHRSFVGTQTKSLLPTFYREATETKQNNGDGNG